MPKASRFDLLIHNTDAYLIITFFIVAQSLQNSSPELSLFKKSHKVHEAIKVLGKEIIFLNPPVVEKAF